MIAKAFCYVMYMPIGTGIGIRVSRVVSRRSFMWMLYTRRA